MKKTKQEKMWDIFKYVLKRINMIEGRKSSRNERMADLIVEKWYYVFVFVKDCGLSKNFQLKKSKNQRTKEPKNQRTKEPKNQQSKDSTSKESKKWKIGKLKNWQNEQMKKN